MTTDYIVTGMSCAACVSRVEKAAGSVKGVKNVTVNLLTGDMRVEGDFVVSEVMDAVKDAGYGARLRSKTDRSGDVQKKERSKDIRRRIVILAVSAVLLAVLMTVSMTLGMDMGGHDHTGGADVMIVSGVIQAVLSLAVIIINYRIFFSGFKALFKLSPNMDSLVATGVVASFGYSLAVLIKLIVTGDTDPMPDFYFESSAMILTFMGIGKLLEAIAKGRATDAVSSLKELVPDSCTVMRDGTELEIPTKEVAIGETVIIKPGDRIALDCEIISGSSEIDESSVTGESIPVFKKAGDKAVSGTVNITGVITAKVTSVSGETTVDRMAELVREIASTKAPIAKVADKVAAVFVPAVMAIALVVLSIWLIAGKDIGYSLTRAVSVLVISCPCALGLATPVAIICGSAAAAKRGVLYKTSEALEISGRVKTVVFDKTGTLTKGLMTVKQTVPGEGVSEKELAEAAALCESGGTHPIAAAIVKYAADNFGFKAEDKGLEKEFIPGQGAKVITDNGTIYCGKKGFLPSDPGPVSEAESFAGSAVYVSRGSSYLGAILISDSLADNAEEAISDLHRKNIKTVMLTGDNENSARAVAELVGIDDFRAGLLPGDKSGIVSELAAKSKYKVAMVGDGINDAPALTAADVGIAIGRGTDIAMEAADVVITGTSLKQVSGAILMAGRTLNVIHENLFWAFGYNIIGIPLAAGLFTLINESFALSPAFASIAMSISSVLVVTNSLRLLALGNKCFGKLPKRDNKTETNACNCSPEGDVCAIIGAGSENKPEEGEMTACEICCEGEEKMVKTVVEVKGMMCGNCERHVNNAVKNGFDVISVESSHDKNETVIFSKEALDEKKLREVIEEEGYEAGRIVTE